MRAGPAFTPFASRGRRAVAAILATFALFSAVSVALSIWSTSRSQYKASVLEVAARQRTLSERYLREVFLARAGEVRLVIKNRGPDTHEVMIARTSKPLPLRADNITVDEDALEPVTLGEVEGELPGAEEVLRLKLRPGRYELFCNMAGHYLAGVRARLVVS